MTTSYVKVGNEVKGLEIQTVAIENFEYMSLVGNKQRTKLLKKVLSLSKSDIILFPAGFFQMDEMDKEEIHQLSKVVSNLIKEHCPETVVCLGIDCNYGVDQLGVAISSQKILAMGRKFYPTKAEKGEIITANSFNATEMGYERIFEIKKTKFYVAVCYDCFGIRHKNEQNPDVDVVLGLVHQFFPKGQGNSGDVDFARKGFGGASQHWKCPVFGTAVFYDRIVPPNFPTGVLWVGQEQSVKNFKYTDNQIAPISVENFEVGYESAFCKTYRI